MTRCSAFSQWSRGRSLHATPKLRVGEMHVDKKTGQVDLRLEAFTDREKVIEYIEIKFELDRLQSLDRTISTLADADEHHAARARSGWRSGGDFGQPPVQGDEHAVGGEPDRSGPGAGDEPDLHRGVRESSARHGMGYGEVTFTPRPEIPRQSDRVREQSEMLASV